MKTRGTAWQLALVATLLGSAVQGSVFPDVAGPFMLRSKTKTDLCLDDGANTAMDKTVRFSLKPCSGAPSQLFVNSANLAGGIETKAKPNACLTTSGTFVTYGACVDEPTPGRVVKATQFRYEMTTFQLYASATSRSLCMDDGGSWGDATAMGIKACDSNSFNQLFEPLDPSFFQTALLDLGAAPFTMCVGEAQWCVSDGGFPGNRGNGFLFVHPQIYLDYETMNQFLYEPNTMRIKMLEKPTLCMEMIVDATSQLRDCSASSTQQFVYNDYTKMLSLSSTRDQCFENFSDGGTQRLRKATCSFTSVDQRFTITPVPRLAPVTTTTPDPEAVAALRVFTSDTFVLQSLTKTQMCLDDDGRTLSSGDAVFNVRPCSGGPSQQFKLTPNGEIASATKPTVCLNTRSGYLMDFDCGGQYGIMPLKFRFNPLTYWIESTSTTSSYCISDSLLNPSAPYNQPTQIKLCKVDNPGMQFVPVSLGATLAPNVFTTATPFALCADAKCLSDASSLFSTLPDVVAKMLGEAELPYPTANLLVYEPASRHVRLLEKPTLCLDAKATNRETPWLFSPCVDGEASQKIVYLPSSQVVLYDYTQVCMERGNDGLVRAVWCDRTKDADSVQLVPLAPSVADSNPPSLAGTAASTLFSSGGSFVIRSLLKTDFCVDDGGGTGSSAQLKLLRCHYGPSQQFVRRSGSGELMSASRSTDCVALADSGLQLTYKTCGASKGFAADYSPSSFQIRRQVTNPYNQILLPYCITDMLTDWTPNGETAQSPFTLSLCSSDDTSQQLLPVPVTTPVVSAVWKSNTVFSVCTTDLGLCLSDSSGLVSTTAGVPLKMLGEDDLPFPTAALFVYDSATFQIKSIEKASMCVEAPVTGLWALNACSSTVAEQTFVYNELTQSLSPYAARRRCLDRTAGVLASDDTVTSADCTFEGEDSNQDVVLVAAPTPAAQTTASIPTLGLTSDLPAYTSGSPFRIRSLTKTDLCLDDDGSTETDGSTVISLKQCVDSAASQKFVLAPSGQIQKFGGSVCLSLASTSLDLTYQPCGIQSLQLTFDITTFQLKRPVGTAGQQQYCVQDTVSPPWFTSVTSLKMALCDTTAADQRFMPQLLSSPVLLLVLDSKARFTLCLAATPSLCLSDTSNLLTAAAGTPIKLLASTATPYATSTEFVYDKATSRILLADKPTMCVEAPSPSGTWVLGLCATNSPNQKFVYNPYTRVLARWSSRNLCLDGTIGKTATNAGAVSTTTCQLVGGTNQRFIVTAVVVPPTALPPPASALATAARTAFLSQPFVLRSLYKTDLCLDDGGSTLSTGLAKISLAQCTMVASQRFVRRISTGEIQSVSKPTLCLALTTGGSGLTYRTCGTQRLVLSYAYATYQLQTSSSATKYCVEDTTISPWAPSANRVLMLDLCDTTAVNQRFLPQALTAPLLPPVFNSQSNFTICLSSTLSQCLSDGALLSSTASGVLLRMKAKTLPTYRGANVFVYDKTLARIQSAAKPALCIENVGAGAWTLATCSATSVNQKFVYNTYTKLLARYDGRDRCLDTALGSTLGYKAVATGSCPGDGTTAQQFDLAVAV